MSHAPALRLSLAACLLFSLAACGDDGEPHDHEHDSAPVDAIAADGPAIDAPPVDLDAPTADAGAFTLTSTAYAEGGVIPDVHSCAGDNISPALAWTAAAADSYAIVFTDLNNGLIHSIIYDIPANVLALPEDVEKVAEPSVPAGSKQPLAYDNDTRGYLGPCPGSTHTYQFTIHAIDEAELSGVTIDSTRTQVNTAILAHSTATASLTATFTP
jgi:Raf kinase inhibitor-like YbhB/YbcL family protein